MLNLRRGIDINFDDYEKAIKVSGTKLYVDYQKFKCTADYFKAQSRSMQNRAAERIAAASNGKNRKATREPLLDTLLNYCGVDEKNFKERKSSSTLTTGKEVIAQYIKNLEMWAKDVDMESNQYCDYMEMNNKSMTQLNQIVYNILTDYSEFKTLQSAGSYQKKLELMHDTDLKDRNHTKLKSINFEYEQATTRRYYTNKDSIQNWHKSLCSSIVAPQGYSLWWGDLPQIDLRMFLFGILMPADPHLGEIARASDDLYEVFTRYMFASMDKIFDPDEFKRNRKIYKTGILASLYGMSAGSLVKSLNDVEIAKMFTTFFASNEAYREFLRRVDDVFDFGEGVSIKDYFDVEAGVQYYGDGSYMTQLHNKALSTPNQCGSNSVIVAWVTNVLKEFEKYGLRTRLSFDPDPEYDILAPVIEDMDEDSIGSEVIDQNITTPQEEKKLTLQEIIERNRQRAQAVEDNKIDVDVLLIRHDEVVLMLSDKARQYQWILDSASTINIDDWIPIRMSVGVGYNYTIEDEELRKEYDLQAKENAADSYIIEPRIVKSLGKFEPLKKSIKAVTYSNLSAVDFLIKEIGVVADEARTLSEEEALKWLDLNLHRLNPTKAADAKDFIRWYGKVNYKNPITGEWLYERPVEELKQFDVHGIMCYNLTGSSYRVDWDGPLFKYSNDNILATRHCLDESIPWDSITPDQKNKNAYHVSEYAKGHYGSGFSSVPLSSKRGSKGDSGLSFDKFKQKNKASEKIDIACDKDVFASQNFFGNYGVNIDNESQPKKGSKFDMNIDDVPW